MRGIIVIVSVAIATMWRIFIEISSLYEMQLGFLKRDDECGNALRFCKNEDDESDESDG
jgi:hypothetical protein